MYYFEEFERRGFFLAIVIMATLVGTAILFAAAGA